MQAAAGSHPRKRRRPAWADNRPGWWLVGLGQDDFYVQRGDFVLTQADVAAAAADPLAFIVPPHSSSSSTGLGDAYVHLCKVVDVSRDSITVSFFYNSQRSLLEPLQYQGGVVQQVLACSSVCGKVLHVLEPDSGDEVLTRVDAAVVAAVQGVVCDMAAYL